MSVCTVGPTSNPGRPRHYESSRPHTGDGVGVKVRNAQHLVGGDAVRPNLAEKDPIKDLAREPNAVLQM